MVPMHGQNRLVRRQLGKKLEIAPTKKEAQFSKRQPHSLQCTTTTRAKSGPEFCELTATGAPTSKGFRAWVIKFIIHLHLLVLPSTIEAVRRAGQDPLNLGAEWLVSSEQGRIVFDALVGCGPSGLPSDLLLSFSPDILTGALGVAAIAFISRMVLVVTDEGAAVLQAWLNQPRAPPVSKKWVLGPGLVQWSRTLEQLVACDCAPSLVAQRLSLYEIDYSLLDKFLGEFCSRTAFGGPQKKLLPLTFFRSFL